MKTKDKNKVIALLASHQKAPKKRYAVLVEKLLELNGATPMQKRFYNGSIYSPVNLDSLEYDIKKLCSITDRDIKKAVSTSKAPAPKTGEQRLLEFDPLGSEEELRQAAIDLVEFSGLAELLPKDLPQFSKGLPGNNERKQWLAEKEINHSFTTKADLQSLIEEKHAEFTKFAYAVAIDNLKEAHEKLINDFEVKEQQIIVTNAVTALETAPEEVKQSIKLRDEFPFLAEDDCPDEFKILVADKLNAYYGFVEGRQELKALVEAGATNDELFELAKKTVGDFQLNLEIYDELNYYKEHKQILGEHPIFAEKMLQEKVDNMGTVDLTKRQKTLRTYVSRDQKKFDKMEAGEAKDKFSEKLQSWKDELKLVDARLEKIS